MIWLLHLAQLPQQQYYINHYIFPPVPVAIAVLYHNCMLQAWRLLHAIVEHMHYVNRYIALGNAVLDFVDAHCSIVYNRFGTLIISLQSLLQSFQMIHDA